MQTNPTQLKIQQMLTSTPPVFSEAEAERVAAEHYGIDARVRPLVSERDQNFRLDTIDGNRFTLKIANHAEQPQVVDFQNRALLHVAEQDPSLPLPRVVPDHDGQLHCTVEHAGKTHIVRVLSWLDGVILDDTKPGPELVYRLGSLLARLGLALKDFDHPGSNPPLLWDMKRAGGLRDLLVHMDDPELRGLISDTLDRFISDVKPTLDTLRTQVIHNDMSLGNVLVDKMDQDQISGVIDFGDLVKSPLIIDLAVAAAYQLDEGDDPLAGAMPLISGYHTVRPLQTTEIRLLTDLIRTRLVTSLLIGSYRVKLFPENREYLTVSHDSSRHFLTKLAKLGNELAFDRIMKNLQTASS